MKPSIMTRPWTWFLALALAALVAGTVAAGDKPSRTKSRTTASTPSPQQIADARRAFLDVARVLMSPRCRNCHPRGNAPLQTDAGRPHVMNVTRLSAESGLPCSTCHQEQNSDAMGIVGGPPGAHHWQLPPRDTPMPFEGHTATSLCQQLKDPERNGRRSLADLVEHVENDALVLWGWSPGGQRTKPPLAHEDFVAAVATWAEGGGACPKPAQ